MSDQNQLNTKPWDNANLSASEKLALLRKSRGGGANNGGVPATPTPLLDARSRISAETPGGTALVFGTPARFHAGSPVGRKSVQAAKTKVAVTTLAQVAPQPHPNPPRPFASIEPVSDGNANIDSNIDDELAVVDATVDVAQLADNDVDDDGEVHGEAHNDDDDDVVHESEQDMQDFKEQQLQLRAALITPPLSPANAGQMFSPIATDVSKELESASAAAIESSSNSSNSAAAAADVTAELSHHLKTPMAIKNTPVVSDAGSVVNTPYVEDRLQAALARAQAANIATPRADSTPISKKMASKPDSEKLEALAQLEHELQLTRERHAELVAAVGGKARTIDAKQLDAERKAMQAEIDQRQRQMLKFKQIACDKDDEIGGVNARLRSSEAELVALRDSTAGLNELLSDAKRQIGDKDGELTLLRAEKQAMQQRIADLLEQAKHNLAVRRRLNNEIQELKGNIRVYCRVRPVSKDEPADQSHRITYPNDEQIRIATTEKSNIGGGDKKKEWQFSFNRTFDPKMNQQAIFEEISGLVQSALDGFNVCVFAYGQTGAGKTYTMEGPNALDMDDWSKGVIPRAVEQIFTYAAQQAQLGWTYEIHTSFLEIYLDDCYDLLATESGTERSVEREKLAVLQQRDGSVEIAGLTVVPVSQPEEVYELLKRAAMHRATAATRKNDRSSRSHSVFQMKLVGNNLETQASTEGYLNLVDLAGSERVAQSGATGEQLKEAQSINKSLSTLGDVIRAVGEGSAHVPYRNSKLTRLLEPYLGGNSKTLMFVNISPNSRDISESISSLRFAEQVGSCTLGRLSKNNAIAAPAPSK